MKANIPIKSKLTKQQKGIIEQFAQKEIEKEQRNMTRRFFKLIALALRDPLSPKGHGMGANSILKVMVRISQYVDECGDDVEFWVRTDRALIDQLKLPLERECI